METILVIALIIPVIIALVSRVVFSHTITTLEAIAQIVPVVLIVLIAWGFGRYSDARDVELWNGEITKKEQIKRDCPWGWRDYQDSFCTEYRTRVVEDGQTCTTDSDGNLSCTTNYKTQYKYIYEWEQRYFLRSNIDASFEVSRIDPQGIQIPPRYDRAYVGEPASASKSYMNWVKAASTNIFHEDGQAEQKYQDILPEYPGDIYDLYVVNRIVGVGDVVIPEGLNDHLRQILRTLGPQRQMNAIVVLVDTKVAGPDFPYAVRRYWRGFKKNDAVVFVGLNNGILEWANVMSWSKKSLFDIQLRDEITKQRGKQIDLHLLMDNLSRIGHQHYERRSMSEFEYLKSQIPTPSWLTITAILFSLLSSLGLAWIFHRN